MQRGDGNNPLVDANHSRTGSNGDSWHPAPQMDPSKYRLIQKTNPAWMFREDLRSLEENVQGLCS